MKIRYKVHSVHNYPITRELELSDKSKVVAEVKHNVVELVPVDGPSGTVTIRQPHAPHPFKEGDIVVGTFTVEEAPQEDSTDA